MPSTRVIIVEHEATTAHDLQNRVEGLGFTVTGNCTSIEAAFEKVEADPPDLVLMDLDFEGDEDGIDTAEVIHSRWGIPVVFVTASEDQERLRRAKFTLPFGYLLKPLQDRDIKITIDMTLYVAEVDRERRRAEQDLRESEERYRTLVERNPYGIQEIDRAGKIVFANAAHHEIYGYEKNELIGRSIPDFLVPGLHSELPGYLAMLVKDQPPPTPYHQRILTKNREEKDIEVSWNYLRDESGDVTGFISVLTDITERKRAEEDRLNLERQVQYAQKLESLGVLASGIAHDFNNLLMGVLGNADLAMSRLSPTSPARREIEDIRRSANRAAELATQMLAYSGKGRFVVELVDLSALVNEIAHLLKVSIAKKALLKFDLAPELPGVEVDVTQIHQVIMNLIINASEAIGDKSGVISITTAAMFCDQQHLAGTHGYDGLGEGTYVSLEVSDTGHGMDQETKDRLFDPFFTTKFTGRGLGMAAALGIVRGHHGAIKVSSEPGRGTTVKLLLPASDLPVMASGSPEAAAEEWRGSGTVLLVDDEETVRSVAGKMIEKLGFRMLTAADGREGVNLFREHVDEIDLVILDMTMPHKSGDEVYREIRGISPRTKIILSSGHNEQDAISRFTSEGLAGFIQKPYGLDELREKLREVLGSESEGG
jgi:two-component system cell cycle sensor histidine kinase/response regulator CckA